MSPAEQIFNFWMEFFLEATKSEQEEVFRFPCLILEPGKVYMPSYVCINLGAEPQTLQVNYYTSHGFIKFYWKMFLGHEFVWE